MAKTKSPFVFRDGVTSALDQFCARVGRPKPTLTELRISMNGWRSQLLVHDIPDSVINTLTAEDLSDYAVDTKVIPTSSFVADVAQTLRRSVPLTAALNFADQKYHLSMGAKQRFSGFQFDVMQHLIRQARAEGTFQLDCQTFSDRSNAFATESGSLIYCWGHDSYAREYARSGTWEQITVEGGKPTSGTIEQRYSDPIAWFESVMRAAGLKPETAMLKWLQVQNGFELNDPSAWDQARVSQEIRNRTVSQLSWGNSKNLSIIGPTDFDGACPIWIFPFPGETVLTETGLYLGVSVMSPVVTASLNVNGTLHKLTDPREGYSDLPPQYRRGYNGADWNHDKTRTSGAYHRYLAFPNHNDLLGISTSKVEDHPTIFNVPSKDYKGSRTLASQMTLPTGPITVDELPEATWPEAPVDGSDVESTSHSYCLPMGFAEIKMPYTTAVSVSNLKHDLKRVEVGPDVLGVKVTMQAIRSYMIRRRDDPTTSELDKKNFQKALDDSEDQADALLSVTIYSGNLTYPTKADFDALRVVAKAAKADYALYTADLGKGVTFEKALAKVATDKSKSNGYFAFVYHVDEALDLEWALSDVVANSLDGARWVIRATNTDDVWSYSGTLDGTAVHILTALEIGVLKYHGATIDAESDLTALHISDGLGFTPEVIADMEVIDPALFKKPTAGKLGWFINSAPDFSLGMQQFIDEDSFPVVKFSDKDTQTRAVLAYKGMADDVSNIACGLFFTNVLDLDPVTP